MSHGAPASLSGPAQVPARQQRAQHLHGRAGEQREQRCPALPTGATRVLTNGDDWQEGEDRGHITGNDVPRVLGRHSTRTRQAPAAMSSMGSDVPSRASPAHQQPDRKHALNAAGPPQSGQVATWFGARGRGC